MSFILEAIPDEWKITVTLLSDGGRDDLGNLKPFTKSFIEGCLLAPKGSNDPLDRSSYVEGEAILYMPTGLVIKSTDRIETPEGSPLVGKWSVSGDPIAWPFGMEVPLTKEG